MGGSSGRINIFQSISQHTAIELGKIKGNELHARDGQVEKGKWYGRKVTLNLGGDMFVEI